MGFGLPRKFLILSRCFNFHFPDSIECEALSHMLICHLYICKVSVKVFGSFLKKFACFLIIYI